MLSPYAELHCASNFTFLRGASHPEELVERAHALDYAALAVTDECSLAGVVRAHLRARELGLPLLVGAQFSLREAFGDDSRLVLIAASRNGYGNLSELITRARMRADKGHYRLLADDLAEGIDDCLALLVPSPAIAVDPAAGSPAPPPDSPCARLLRHARFLRERFDGRCWLGVPLLVRGHDAALLERTRGVAAATGLPRVAVGDVLYHLRSRKTLQDTLTAIRLNTPLAALGYALAPNAEQHLRSRLRLARLYPPALLEETLEVAARCRFSLDELRYEYPEEIVPAGHTPASWLRALVFDGVPGRYPDGLPPAVAAQLEHELALIAELKYEPYFLTVADIVHFARGRGILCQGRGSAANSAVCYCLGITEVDPARTSVLFERFISRERNEPPDIDVDFEHQRREEVIQHLYAKYGRHRAALTATVISYRSRSALRDVGRALGIDAQRIEQLARAHQWWDRSVQPERLREAGFDPSSTVAQQWLDLAGALRGFPRHLSQHTGGFVIARDALTRLVPVENAAMPGRSVIEWDKDDLDALGLLKIDVLALGMLTAIRKTLDCVNAWRDTPGVHAGGANGAGSTDSTGNERGAARLTVSDIPPEDPAVYEMLCRGDSVGVFQVESRAQMTMLPRLQPRRYYDLVIEVAIVRPGPIQGGMVHPYLRRRQKVEPVSYPSPEVEGVLERTLGVPIFQEQVMQLSIVAAGFTPGEADRLRRAMAAWRRKGGLEPFEMKLVDGMRARGYDEAFARQIFQQILGFGEYGFPESHAASFALLVYVSAWLKHHHPAAFLCGLLNSLPMGFYAPAQLIQDARRHGVTVLPVDVMVSGRGCVLEAATGSGVAPGPSASARLGLSMVDGLGEPATQRIVAARAVRPFDGIEDLARRATLDAREMRLLASAGALAALAGHRHHALWLAAGSQPPPSLLHASQIADSALELTAPSEGENLVADYRAMGFTLGRHPLALLRRHLARMRFETSQEINEAPHRKLARAAGVVTCRQRPGTASGVVFVTMEDETGTTNVIVHADLVERQRRELLASRLMGVYGQVQREGRVVHLIAKRLVDVSHLLGRLATHSRDFH